jgi:hypothetical protein
MQEQMQERTDAETDAVDALHALLMSREQAESSADIDERDKQAARRGASVDR